MAKNRIYKLPHRRRREQKTDYAKRLDLLKSGEVRLVVRKTLTRTIAQAVRYNTIGDTVVASASSSELKKLGWKGSASNSKAAYLTGIMIGKRAKDSGVERMILDKGLSPSTRGGRIYAVLKGAVEGGVEIPHSKDILPSDERTGGAEVEEIKKAI